VGTAEEAVRSAIVRTVKRECRASYEPLTRDVRELKREVARLAAAVRSLQQSYGRPAAAGAARPQLEPVAEDEVMRARLSPDAIRRLRAGLGVTQAQLATLIGVTGPAIAQWEGGTSEPRGKNRAALVALRKLGRREVGRMLAMSGVMSRIAPKPPRH